MSTLHSTLRRNASTFGIIIIIITVMAILYVQTLAMAKLQNEVAGQQHIIDGIKGVTDQIAGNAKDRTAQIELLNRHLDCMVTFFTQKDRSQKAIDNIEVCTLKNFETGQVVTPALPSMPAPQANKKNVQPAPKAAPIPMKPTPSIFQNDISRIKDLIKGL